MAKISLVLTTINIPTCLEAYLNSIKQYGHKDVGIIVIGDLKTPKGIKEYLQKIGIGFETEAQITYLGIEEQEEFLKPYPELARLIPYNSTQRRNIGFLKAMENKSDIIISIDDDNYPYISTRNYIKTTDYIKHHSVVGKVRSVVCLESNNGYVNPCYNLITSPRRKFYYRGFPLELRTFDNDYKQVGRTGRIVVNSSLWLGVPDVNTFTLLEESFKVTGVSSPQTFGLGVGNWAPIDSQSTAYHISVFPALFLPTMVKGNWRYDDIWMGYIIQKISNKLGDLVTFGKPIVEHRRNLHNLVRDLENEWPAIFTTPELLRVLRKIDISGTTYYSCYEDICMKFKNELNLNKYPIFNRLIRGMEAWLEAVKCV